MFFITGFIKIFDFFDGGDGEESKRILRFLMKFLRRG